MGKFKKGQQIRITHDGVGFDVGDVFTLTKDGDYANFIDNDGDQRCRDTGFELIPATWQPKVGDRVLVTYGHGWDGEAVVELVTCFGTCNVKMLTGKYANDVGGFALCDIEPLPVAAEAQPVALQIEAGKFYKRRDGVKMGPAVPCDDPIASFNLRGPGNHENRYYDAYGKHGAEWINNLPSFDLVAEWVDEPTPLTIEAGKFYRTRDGRKVGPMEAWDADAFSGTVGGEGRLFHTSGMHLYGKTDLDLIALWQGEATTTQNATTNVGAQVDTLNEEYGPVVAAAPSASNDNGPFASLIGKTFTAKVKVPTAKFKVGDRVLVTHTDYPQIPVVTITHIVEIDADGNADLWCRGFDEGLHFYSSEFTTTTQPTAIVALIENGQPKPSEKPRIHASQELAVAEAERLAGIHRGQRFGVFVLHDTRETDAPVYDHEWQRLAMDGKKIDAIRLLRQATGLHLATAKTAVEDWVLRAA